MVWQSWFGVVHCMAYIDSGFQYFWWQQTRTMFLSGGPQQWQPAIMVTLTRSIGVLAPWSPVTGVTTVWSHCQCMLHYMVTIHVCIRVMMFRTLDFRHSSLAASQFYGRICSTLPSCDNFDPCAESEHLPGNAVNLNRLHNHSSAALLELFLQSGAYTTL